MRKDKTARRSSRFDDLFAERQVYLRSGLTSRYVVLSRSIQIAATVGALLVLAGLALASYSSFAKHREVAEQGRELARLAGQQESLRAAAAAAAAKLSATEALAARVPELEAALAEAKRRARPEPEPGRDGRQRGRSTAPRADARGGADPRAGRRAHARHDQ